MSTHDLDDLERRAELGDGDAATALARARVRAGIANAIDRAHAAWQREDHAETLDHLLDAWREHRAPDLAALIEHLSDAIVLEPVPGATRAEREVAWREIAAARRALDLPRLQAALLTFACKTAGDLMVELRDWPADPRWSAFTIGALIAPPNQLKGQGSHPLWLRLLDQIAAAGDRRALEPLSGLVARTRDNPLTATLARSLSREVDRLDRTLPTDAPDALDGPLQSALERFGLAVDQATPVSDDDLESLFAAVYAAPDDDAPRLALARALTALDDPRGEFIALQCKSASGKLTANERKQLKALKKFVGDDWLGALAPVVQKAGRRFERGFLAAARVTNRRVRNLDAILAAPDWATLEALDVSSWFNDRTLLASPHLSGLRELRGLAPDLLAPDRDAGTPYTADNRYDPAVGLAKTAILAQLEHLSVTRGMPGAASLDMWRALWTAPLAPTLESLTFEAPHDPIDWLAELDALTETRITRLVGGKMLELTRDSVDSEDWHLSWHWHWQRIEPATWFANAFASPRLTSIEIDVDKDTRFAITAEALAETRQVLTRFERATHLVLPEPRAWDPPA